MSPQAKRSQRIAAASARLLETRLALHKLSRSEPGGAERGGAGPLSGHLGGVFGNVFGNFFGPIIEAFASSMASLVESSFVDLFKQGDRLLRRTVIPAVRQHPWLSLAGSLLAGVWLARRLFGGAEATSKGPKGHKGRKGRRGGHRGVRWRALLESLVGEALVRAVSEALARALSAMPGEPQHAPATSHGAAEGTHSSAADGRPSAEPAPAR